MNPLHAQALLPFVPSGKDYDGARRLFAALGFTEEWENDGFAGFRCGDARFILQRFEDRHFAENLMLRLEVPDLDAWYRAALALDLGAQHPGFRMTPPKDFPWGREVNLIDPAGVCWHIAAD